jgi:hypothetical protein
MSVVGALPAFGGAVGHDHEQPYYLHEYLHSLYDAHHLRLA